MRGIVLSLLLGLPMLAQAAPLEVKMCVFDHPFPPMTYPDGSGQAQDVLRRASRLQPVQIQPVVAPRFQCMEQLRTGQVDAMLAAFIEDRTSYAAFPMRESQPDVSRAVGEISFSVSRRRGGTVDWDGRQFLNLGRQPVGTQPGLLHVALLRQLNVVIDDSAGSPEQAFAMLAQNRVAAVVTQQGEGEQIIARKYKGEIEMLPTPLIVTPMYLIVNKQFYQQHRAQVDGYWDAVRQVRAGK
ncbi:transporter substrate-binding domain-containing protein [Duganella sp.]|uniref:substrate-binding periplasmic protein n=1 Tax=Duganella sp. TaxID=1904440 RepID=UPI0031E2DECE